MTKEISWDDIAKLPPLRVDSEQDEYEAKNGVNLKHTSTSVPQRRDRNRPNFAPKKRDLVAEINADIARRAALPKDHPEHAIDDAYGAETTGVMGIRDSKELRANATELTRVKRPKKK